MKIITQLKRLFLSLAAGCGLISLTSTAEAVLPAAESDIFLAFRATGGTTNYLVNLGPAAQFTDATGLVNVPLGGNILADIEELFGTDWKTRADVVWSVSGVQKTAGNNLPANTMFASRAQVTPGTQSEGWTRPSAFGAGSPALKMLQMREPGYTAGTTENQVESTNSTKALIQSTSAANSYASYMPGGINTTGLSAFGYFNVAGGIEASFANGTANSVLDFYKLEPGSGPATLVGGFRLNDSAELVFSPDISFFAGPALVRFEMADYSVNEDAGTLTLTVNRTGNTDSAFSLHFSTTDVSATAGVDYTAQSNTVINFGTGETTKTVDIAIVNRAGFQGNRTLTGSILVATGTAQLITPSTANITIVETTPQPAFLAFSSATYSVAENVGTGLVTVTVERTGATNTAVSANLSTTDVTALAGTDYTGQTNTPVSFTSGETSKTVDILIANRAGFQGNRTFTATLSTPSVGAEIGTPATSTITIQESEANPAGTIAFSAATYRVAANLGGGVPNTAVVTLNRTQGTTGAVSVDVAIAAGGTLTAGEDFTFTNPTTVSFVDGQTSAIVNIPFTAAVAPVPGTINLQLSNATAGASIGAQGTTTITATAPDSIAPKLIVTSPKSGKSTATVNVAGSVTDPDLIDRVELTLNGAAPQNATLGARTGDSTPFSFTLNAENGANTLLVQAFDVNGTPTKLVKINFTYTNIRPELAGNYAGIVSPTAATPPANNLNNASGLFTLKVAPTGTFSGKILIGGATLPIGGTIANNGNARFKPALGTSLNLASKGKNAITFGALSFTVASGQAIGAIGTVATFEANRAAFDGKTPATTVDAKYLENKGKYTGVLPSEAQPVLTSNEFPQGDGVVNISVTKQGKVTVKGKLADGTPLTMSGALSSGYEVQLFAALYAKKGSIAGIVALDDTQADSDMEGEDFLWIRPANTKAKHYPAGWPSGVSVDLLGASYAATPGTSVFPGLGPEDVGNGNATLQAADGKLTAPVSVNLNISAKNKVTNAPTTDKSFKVTIAAPTGAIGGSFTHSDGSKPKITAIIYQKGPNAGAYGYFLSTVPKNAPSGEAGGISLIAK